MMPAPYSADLRWRVIWFFILSRGQLAVCEAVTVGSLRKHDVDWSENVVWNCHFPDIFWNSCVNSSMSNGIVVVWSLFTATPKLCNQFPMKVCTARISCTVLTRAYQRLPFPRSLKMVIEFGRTRSLLNSPLLFPHYRSHGGYSMESRRHKRE